MRLLVRGVRTVAGVRDLRVAGRRIADLGRGLAVGRRERVLDARELVALPGLINAHDHLSLNLLPPLGTPPYADLYAFADDVYRPEQPPLDPIQSRTAVRDRLLWGGLKNLIAGVTTVAHHDPFSRRIFGRRFPVKVVRRYGWSHSLGFGPDPAAAYRACRGAPFVIHAAEGTSTRAGGEIERLATLGALGPSTVLVHAVALDARAVAQVAASGAGVVWCPHSNLRLYGRTAPVPALRAARVIVALGTDATMSGAPTLLDEARDAVATGLADAEEVLEMVTARAARLFRLADGRGTLAAGGPADALLIPDTGDAPADALLRCRPGDLALVLADGRPRLADPPRAEALGVGPANARISGRETWLDADLAGLRRRLARAAGERELRRGVLWQRMETIAGP